MANLLNFYTERYWELIGLIAQRIKGTGQNVIMLPVQTLVQYKIDGDKYSFDFAYLDRMVSIYQKAGVLKRMAGSHCRVPHGRLDQPVWRRCSAP